MTTIETGIPITFSAKGQYKRPFTDLTGQRFGRLVVQHREPARNVRWRCKCDCGGETVALNGHLLKNKHKGCGQLGCNVNTIVTAKGYVLTRCPGHPRLNRGGQIFEHILVMERRLGRYLLPHENVHHKNGNRADNRDCNLELWSRHQPPGQRVEDKVAYALEILATYAPERLS